MQPFVVMLFLGVFGRACWELLSFGWNLPSMFF